MRITYNEPQKAVKRLREDAIAVQNFALESDASKTSMTITYDSVDEARRRGFCLRTLITQNPDWKLILTQRQEKLFFIKIS